LVLVRPDRNPLIRAVEQADSTSATSLNGLRSHDFVILKAQKNRNHAVDLRAATSMHCPRKAFVEKAFASFS
jgi:hypothetical protein